MPDIPKRYNNGEWTQARMNSFIKSALRSASQRWPPKYKVLSDSYRLTKINEKTGRMAKHYECNRCKELFPLKDVEVNHIIPIVPISGFDNWDGVIQRLFCEKEGMETLCKPCHKIITKEENESRASRKSSE
jgi:5-methylcytosine-specific restriction endonuclease McrA